LISDIFKAAARLLSLLGLSVQKALPAAIVKMNDSSERYFNMCFTQHICLAYKAKNHLIPVNAFTGKNKGFMRPVQ
ncbi:MAG: hypothetical protein V4543_15195, partial [Bacteroidota bacterium]